MKLFVDRANGVSGACSQTLDCAGATLVPGPRALRRLSRAEYDNTVNDLFGAALAQPSTYGAALPADNPVENFDNNAAALTVAPLFADNLRTAAEALAQSATSGTSLAALLPCDPAKAGADACAVSFIQSFGARAFRRPLTQAEVVSYKTLYNVAADNAACADPFTSGIQLVITGMLQSPNFLYRTELGDKAGPGGLFTLTPYEVASELSYLLWGSMPDDALFAAAKGGTLATPEKIGMQANRMMQSPKSRATLDHFVEQWLDITTLGEVPKDATVYPAFTDAIRGAMRAETVALVEHAVYDQGGSFADLFTSKTSYMSSALAAFYGFTPSGQPDPTTGLYQIALPSEGYAGVLTQGSVLAVHAKANASSPILRGKLVREQLLCQDLPPPPAGVNASPPKPSPTTSTRELYLEHAKNQPCASCHRLLDPVGFGFESFDGVGVYRPTENGMSVDASGQIVSSKATDGTFTGASDLGQKLAQSPEVQQCFALEWFRFAYGIDQTAALQCTVQKLAKDFAGNNLAMGQLILDLTQQPHFSARVSDGVQGDGSIPPDTGGTPPASMPPAPSAISLAFANPVSGDGMGHWWAQINVTNTSTASVTWKFSMTINGTLSNLFGAVTSINGTTVQFSGDSSDATLQPGRTANVSFEVTGSAPQLPTCQ
jgi:hypothetical protein